VLAVGIATSFTEPTFHNGKFYRPGEIVDADMLFNPAKNFRTATQGTGKDLKSIAVHEGGHLYGLSHSAVHSSTMFPILLGGTAAQTGPANSFLSQVWSGNCREGAVGRRNAYRLRKDPHNRTG